MKQPVWGMPQSPLCGGVYIITCVLNGNQYIGETGDFHTRWKEHRALLRSGEHPSTFFQIDWNRYGEQSFYAGVITHGYHRFKPLSRALTHCHVLEREWIERLNPAYNRRPYPSRSEILGQS